MLTFADTTARMRSWVLEYEHLSYAEVAQLQALFIACSGRLLPFTFVDPTENMLSNSMDLTAAPWSCDPGISVMPGQPDPMGGESGFLLTNSAQVPAGISQQLPVPANYQSCFSLFVQSEAMSACNLRMASASTSITQSLNPGTAWQRASVSGTLNDGSIGVSVACTLSPGQSVVVFGPQLEAQVIPSRYRPTQGQGGVYANAYWAMDTFSIAAEAPNLYSLKLSIEASA